VKRKSLQGADCPIALSLDRVGEWWNILILRDAMQGSTKFDDFRRSLDISPTMLTRKLNALVESGMLERRIYLERPRRHQYLLTDLAKDFAPVMIALFGWGKRHFQDPAEGTSLVDLETGGFAEPLLIDKASGKPFTADCFRFMPGNNASEATRRRLGNPVAGRRSPGPE
jgi:DNA-binding HxlR family transcriptional regulator